MLLTQKLRNPEAGRVVSRGVTLDQPSTLDPRSDDLMSVTEQLTTLRVGAVT